jgi:hypothetical protein
VRGEAAWPAGDEVCLEGVSRRSADLLGEADGMKGCEGNKGDTDMAVTEADGCAL